MRDEFTEDVKRTLAARTGNACSNPGCYAVTSGPQSNSAKALNVGVAAHISAASEGGQRYNPSLRQGNVQMGIEDAAPRFGYGLRRQQSACNEIRQTDNPGAKHRTAMDV